MSTTIVCDMVLLSSACACITAHEYVCTCTLEDFYVMKYALKRANQ